MLDAGIKVLFVAHLCDLAQSFHQKHMGSALFLRAEWGLMAGVPSASSKGEPLPTRYDENLYERVFGARSTARTRRSLGRPRGAVQRPARAAGGHRLAPYVLPSARRKFMVFRCRRSLVTWAWEAAQCEAHPKVARMQLRLLEARMAGTFVLLFPTEQDYACVIHPNGGRS